MLGLNNTPYIEQPKASAPLGADWSVEINADYQKRGRKPKKKYAIKNIILPLSKRDYYAAIAVFPSFLLNLTNDFVDKVFLFFNYDLLFLGFSAAGFDILWGSFRYNDEKRVQSRRHFQSRNASRSPGFPIARRQAAAVPFCNVSG